MMESAYQSSQLKVFHEGDRIYLGPEDKKRYLSLVESKRTKSTKNLTAERQEKVERVLSTLAETYAMPHFCELFSELQSTSCLATRKRILTSWMISNMHDKEAV